MGQFGMSTHKKTVRYKLFSGIFPSFHMILWPSCYQTINIFTIHVRPLDSWIFRWLMLSISVASHSSLLRPIHNAWMVHSQLFAHKIRWLKLRYCSVCCVWHGWLEIWSNFWFKKFRCKSLDGRCSTWFLWCHLIRCVFIHLSQSVCAGWQNKSKKQTNKNNGWQRREQHQLLQ